MEYGLIGEKLGHSYSAEIHALLADYGYELREIPKEGVAAFMTARDFKGINVTIPYKQTVMPFLDFISDEALKIGAVNTVVNRGGRLYGYNTDHRGMMRMFQKHGIELKGKKVMILGTGGTSKTALYTAKVCGASEIVTVSRSRREGCISYEEAAKRRDTQILINTTPCGMFPEPDKTPIDPACFPELSGVADAIYNPLRTDIVTAAEKRGVPAAGGLFMLTAQAVYACELFTGKTVPAEKAEEVFRRVRAEKENIVLTGMPGSGKSTVGRMLAKELGRNFVDTDALITEKTGTEPGTIIREKGESAFRDIEERAVAEAAAKSACVIATGGGAILRDRNVHALKRNGRIFFIDRPIELIKTTDDRPLSSDREKLERVFGSRYERYKSTADVICENGREGADAVVRKIKEALL